MTPWKASTIYCFLKCVEREGDVLCLLSGRCGLDEAIQIKRLGVVERGRIRILGFKIRDLGFMVLDFAWGRRISGGIAVYVGRYMYNLFSSSVVSCRCFPWYAGKSQSIV